MDRKRSIAVALLIAFAAYRIYSTYQNRSLKTSGVTVDVNGTMRSYQMIVPRDLQTPCPVVFAFHGLGDTPEAMATYTKLGRQAFSYDFVLVFPTAVDSHWDVEVNDGDDLNQHDDVQFFDAALAEVKSEMAVDRNRVYAVGMSNGAAFVQLLAHARSDVIAAVAAHSGQCPRNLPKPEQAFPIFLLSGSEDGAASVMKDDVEAYKAAGHDAKLMIINGLGHKWSIPHNENIWKFLSRHELDDSGSR